MTDDEEFELDSEFSSEDLDDVAGPEELDDEGVLEDEAILADEDLEDEDLEDEESDESDEDHDVGESALDELAEEELELLDEEEDTDLPINEAAELRAIRREELTLDVEAQAIRGDEFVCSVCFLVKRSSQLANRRKVICRDCAA